MGPLTPHVEAVAGFIVSHSSTRLESGLSCMKQKLLVACEPISQLCLRLCAASPVIPINDIRGVETFGYTKQEKVLRCKLAACYRLVDLFGWTHGIFNHISVSLHVVHPVFCMRVGGAVQVKVTAGHVCHIMTY